MGIAIDNPIRLASIQDAIAVYGWHNLMIICWLRRPTVAAAEELKQARADFVARHPEGVSIVHLMMGAAEPPPQIRSTLVDMIRVNSQAICSVAVVTLRGGFDASAVRSRVTGMRMEAGGEAKLRFHSTVQEVFAWLPEVHERETNVQLEVGPLSRWLQAQADAIMEAARTRASDTA
ncbi:MAG: hypothetical protein OXU20_16840 [Myxococcales bacterium]|nr:hypothetical protein [Myxococcales bacterium]MDD9965646.1 hypothetical protein [Myxococcales bacterium]